MKKFILNKVIGETFTNESVITMIENNIYKLDEFEPHENIRYGFSAIHQKLDNLHLAGNGYVCATFKIANKQVNKKVAKDLVKKRVSEAKAKGVDYKVKVIEEAVADLLKPKAEIKIKTFDLIFDTKNSLIFCSGTGKDFDTLNTLVMRSSLEGCTTRPFKAKFDGESLADLFTIPEKLPENFKIGNFAKIDIDDETFSFENVNLKESSEFERLIEQKFTVTGMSLVLSEESFNCSFKLNKKGLTSAISANAIESDASMVAEADATSGGEAKDLSPEEKLYDLLYTNSFVLVDALFKIANFVYDLKQHDEKNNTKSDDEKK